MSGLCPGRGVFGTPPWAAFAGCDGRRTRRVRLELGPADAVVSANQPVLEISDYAVRERHDRTGSFAERRPERLLERDVLIPSGLQAGERFRPSV